MQQSLLIKALRWIAVLPASFAASFLAHILSVLGNSIFGDINSLFTHIIASTISSAVFVYAGYFVAPKGRSVVAIVLCTIYNIILIMSIILSFVVYSDREFWEQIILIATNMISSIYACWALYQYDKNNEIL